MFLLVLKQEILRRLDLGSKIVWEVKESADMVDIHRYLQIQCKRVLTILMKPRFRVVFMHSLLFNST
jgi:hypothetical protein